MLICVMFSALCVLLCTLKSVSFAQTVLPFSNHLANVKKDSKIPKEIEYGVKAAFIYNIMKFVEWPQIKKAQADEKEKTTTAMIIGILGDNPFGTVFEPILSKTIQKREISVITIEGYSSFGNKIRKDKNDWQVYCQKYQEIIKSCDVLFVCESEQECLDDLLALTQRHMILTVSDTPEFAKDKGIVGFIKDDNKVRFEINLTIAKEENIKIRTQLLKLAKEVYQKVTD